jgi:branched-chain amino acid aminotransferase
VDTRVFVDGRLSPPGEASVPVMDHGFLFGDSVYEVLWWHRGALIQEDEHLERLAESARRLYFSHLPPRERLLSAVAETVAAAGAGPEDDAYVRLIVTRGVGPLGLDFTKVPEPSVIVIVAPAKRPGPEAFEKGLGVALVERRRNSPFALDPRAKTGNYLNNVLALHEARLAGADDALMLNERGEVTEATTANVYVVRDGRLATPPLEAGILKGTTRTRVLALAAAHGLPAAEHPLAPDDVRKADEVFVSSSVRGILPVVRVDGAPVGDGTPGPWTRRIHAWFEAAADAEAGRRARGVRADA